MSSPDKKQLNLSRSRQTVIDFIHPINKPARNPTQLNPTQPNPTQHNIFNVSIPDNNNRITMLPPVYMSILRPSLGKLYNSQPTTNPTQPTFPTNQTTPIKI